MGNENLIVSEQILDAAEQRFKHYGYRKTTMAEIAGDTNMSAANLYRYYTNKEDIGAACVLRCMDQVENLLRDVISEKKLSAKQKLLKIILAKFEFTYNEATNNPNINQLVEMFVLEKPELLKDRKEVIQSLIAEVLAEGNQTGEFAIDDIIKTAESIKNATVAFSFPMFMRLFPKEKFREMAINVVELITNGLLPKK